jgi:glycine/D-amino acid oxidase-like deaminating enzyme
MDGKRMRVCILGGGLFGCTAAIYAARAGHDVTLFEKNSDIMQGASKVNQFRLHDGYHYPRSDETVEECHESMEPFLSEYGGALDVRGGEKFYAIAKGSKTSAEEYVDFLDRHCMPWGLVPDRSDLFNYDLLDAVFAVDEDRIHYPTLKGMVTNKLAEAGVTVVFGATRLDWLRNQKGAPFDHWIVAGYASTNEILTELCCEPIEIQYELVEKPQILMPEKYKNTSVVVMDGPFGCIDPSHTPGVHQMGHVHWSVHSRATADRMPFGAESYTLCTRMPQWRNMVGSLGEYLPPVKKARRINSQYVVRAVLPNVDDTDERPTIVRPIRDDVTMIFSGKLGHAVKAAQETVIHLS